VSGKSGEAGMKKRYSITQARATLSCVVREAETGIRVELTRRGEPVAVLIGLEDFERLSKGGSGFWEAYEAFRSRFNLARIKIDPDEIFGDVRGPLSGRDFDW
jgi:antitoxin Phd